jgi:hypothetical protein
MTTKINRVLAFFNNNPRMKIIIPFVFILLVVAAVFGVEKYNDNPASCANCHNMQSYYDSWHAGNLLVKQHADAKINCHDCHTPKMSQQIKEGIKYITGDFETPLKKREFPRAMCLKCHDFEKVKAKTDFKESNPHDSHNGDQECYTCHSMHSQSKVTCSQCHSFPWINKLSIT